MHSTSPSGCQAQCVRMIWKDNECKAINKYAMMINKYAMMINKYARMVETIIDDNFGFCIVNARCKSVFVFSDF